MVESLPIPSQSGKFSFSPVSFHASFVTLNEVTILNVQDSKTLLSTKVVQQLHTQSSHFSPDGCFFACGTSEGGIYIWKNTPTSYILWSTLQPRLPFNEFLFSPTSISILAWGSTAIQLLHPENSARPQHPNKTKPLYQHGSHLVACSADGKYIATAQKGDSVVKVLDPLFGTPLWSIQVGAVIQDIKIVGNIIFVADRDKLASWSLEAGEMECHTRGATVHCIYDSIGLDACDLGNLVLSNDCSHIAFAVIRTVFLYNIKAQEVLIKHVMDGVVMDIQFSQDGCQLGVFGNTEGFNEDTDLYFVTFKMVEDWHTVNVVTKFLADRWSWTSLFRSAYGYYIKSMSEWVTDSRGNNLLWLPPNWRTKHGLDMGWDGDFLAFVGNHHQKPIIIELQPQPHPHPTFSLGILPSNPSSDSNPEYGFDVVSPSDSDSDSDSDFNPIFLSPHEILPYDPSSGSDLMDSFDILSPPDSYPRYSFDAVSSFDSDAEYGFDVTSSSNSDSNSYLNIPNPV